MVEAGWGGKAGSRQQNAMALMALMRFHMHAPTNSNRAPAQKHPNATAKGWSQWEAHTERVATFPMQTADSKEPGTYNPQSHQLSLGAVRWDSQL